MEMRSRPYGADQIRASLAETLRMGDATLVQMVLIAAECKPDALYVDVLCCILRDSNLHHMHINVCALLGEIRDPRAVESLHIAATAVADWDKNYEVPRSALAALAEINSPQARSIISSVARTGPPILREETHELMSEE